uniref:Uncharacterized protein n=1 Tax=Oryza punctata TaxID=4537 RepID=A0A0E0JSC7_ORYPU
MLYGGALVHVARIHFCQSFCCWCTCSIEIRARKKVPMLLLLSARESRCFFICTCRRGAVLIRSSDCQILSFSYSCESFSCWEPLQATTLLLFQLNYSNSVTVPTKLFW